MLLIDLLTIINDNTDVIIQDTNRKDIALYDGKNSIPEKHNNKNVVEISTENRNKKPVLIIQVLL